MCVLCYWAYVDALLNRTADKLKSCPFAVRESGRANDSCGSLSARNREQLETVVSPAVLPSFPDLVRIQGDRRCRQHHDECKK
jgi:hypothetical protein